MKKKQIKALKQLSEQLPESVTLERYSTIVKGCELTQEQIDSAKIPIEVDKEYLQKGNYRVVPINHLNRLKSAYSRNKEQGLVDYIMWVDRNNKRMNEIFKNSNLNEVSEEIMNIAKKGANGFWNNLINFLLAFIAIFKPKNNP